MTRNVRTLTLLSLTFVLFQLPGCSKSAIQIPVPISLANTGLNEFDVAAGVPKELSGAFSFDAPLKIGSGSLEIAADSIRIEPSNNGQGKRPATQQVIADCADACAGAGVDSATCDSVCSQNVLHVHVWIGDADAITANCEDGDEYMFLVQLDDGGVPTSISASPSSLNAATILRLNNGEFGACISIISPIDGTVFIDDLIFNVGL
ncbi:MAG: hypothetical protein AABZ12_06780 [Planctomycetota bacterium]